MGLIYHVYAIGLVLDLRVRYELTKICRSSEHFLFFIRDPPIQDTKATKTQGLNRPGRIRNVNVTNERTKRLMRRRVNSDKR